MTTDTANDLTFYVDRFVLHWFRGMAHLRCDLARFESAYRVPAAQRFELRRRVVESLAEDDSAHPPRCA
jgi:hypothetical protein